MFRLLESALPKDPVFPSDLKSLGYFINEDDEIRSIDNPRAYFHYFLTKSEDHNDKQREAMNTITRNIVYERLGQLGMQWVRLPLGASETEPHIPIYVSSDLSQKKRVIILFYEHNQDLGTFAIRVVGGQGGINKGSAVNMVKYIQSLGSPDAESPGIILANLGQLRWWRRGKQAVTQSTWFALPQKTAVHGPFRFDPIRNTVPLNRSGEEHVKYVLETVTAELCNAAAKLFIIGVSEGAMQVVAWLDKLENWKTLGPRVEALALLAPYYEVSDLENKDFLEWLRKRGRVYLKSNKESGAVIYGAFSKKCSYGCTAYSLGEPYHTELMLPKGYKTVVDWLWEVACTGEGYENPHVEDVKEESEVEESGWTEVEADDKSGTGAAGDEGDAPPTNGQEAASKDGDQGNQGNQGNAEVDNAKVDGGQEAAGKDGDQGNAKVDNAEVDGGQGPNDGDGGENGRSGADKGGEAGGAQGGDNGDADAAPAGASMG